MKRVFLDTNILIDYILARAGDPKPARKGFRRHATVPMC